MLPVGTTVYRVDRLSLRVYAAKSRNDSKSKGGRKGSAAAAAPSYQKNATLMKPSMQSMVADEVRLFDAVTPSKHAMKVS